MKTPSKPSGSLRVLLTMAAVLWPTLSSARTIYVAPDAQRGDGSRQRPAGIWGVLKAAKLRPGDEVVFLDGVYRLAGKGRGGLSLRSVGTAAAPIVYRAEHRHKAVLDGGTPLTGWKAVTGHKGTWACLVDDPVRNVLVNGQALHPAGERRGGKSAVGEGMFACERLEAEGLKEGRYRVTVHPWAGEKPTDAQAVLGTILSVGGAFNVVDGLLVRRGGTGVHLAGRLVHVYRIDAGVYRDLSGLVNNAYGSFNILRNCIVRDTCSSALTSNESRFNLIEGCVIYNAGCAQGSHGIYISQGAENLTLRRNVWWRISGGGVHIYSGTGIDSPRNVVVEYNVFGPDKRNRTFPLANRKSTAVYVWGGSRWAGGNRIVRNIVLGATDRAVSMHRCNFNLIANNTFLNTDGAPIQIGSGFGNLLANNIVEHSPGGPACPGGYIRFSGRDRTGGLSRFRNNLLIPRKGGQVVPDVLKGGTLAASDPFVDRRAFDVRLKAGSDAVDKGIPIFGVTDAAKGTAPDVGALELGEAIYGQAGKFPAIPSWLLKEWPLSNRGQ